MTKTVRDTASGFTLDRPGIEHVRRLLRSGAVDVVLSYAVDRLSRNQNHIGVLFDEVQQAGARLEFVTENFEDTAIGRFILAARAFIAEVEREKIAERTMRGKAARARSGRLSQGTGRGLFGYVYDPQTGTRQVEPAQAAVVQRIFQEFVDGKSCNHIARDLNAREIPARSGGRWHPLTIRRLLSNEAYTGRTVYKRTKAERVRNRANNRWVRKLTERPRADWIEIPGVTPAIVESTAFLAAERLLEDPARHRRGRPSRHYPLRSRLKCARCGTPMVGQALQRGRYAYYRCRNSFGGDPEVRCSSRYIPTGLLEDAVRSAIADVLADPDRVLAEARRLAETSEESTCLEEIEKAIGSVEAKQRRLVKLYTESDLPESLLAEKSQALSAERAALEAERVQLSSTPTNPIDLAAVAVEMPTVLESIRRWIAKAKGDDLDLLLKAIDAEITASREQAEIRGSVPVYEQVPQVDLVTIERTSA